MKSYKVKHTRGGRVWVRSPSLIRVKIANNLHSQLSIEVYTNTKILLYTAGCFRAISYSHDLYIS